MKNYTLIYSENNFKFTVPCPYIEGVLIDGYQCRTCQYNKGKTKHNLIKCSHKYDNQKKATDTYEQALKECKSSTVTAQYVKSKQSKEQVKSCSNCGKFNLCTITVSPIMPYCPEYMEAKLADEKPKVEKVNRDVTKTYPVVEKVKNSNGYRDRFKPKKVKKLRLKISVKKIKYLQEIICDKCLWDKQKCSEACNLSRYIVKEKV